MVRPLLLSFVLLASAAKSDKPAYYLYSKEGNEVSYSDMLNKLAKADIVLFGEIHNNALVHWLQLEVISDLDKANRPLVLGAEMFEADDQLIVDEYLSGTIELRHVEAEAKVWNNFATDYKPLLNFAKVNEVPFVASNVPRRYASLVARQGLSALDSLAAEALQYVAPLPIEIDTELPAYKSMIEMMGGGNHNSIQATNMVSAQAIKDASMAHSILQNLRESSTFVHFNGSYHSDNFEGIYWYLKKKKPDLRVVTISSVELVDINIWDEDLIGRADYIIAVPTTMTKTYR